MSTSDKPMTFDELLKVLSQHPAKSIRLRDFGGDRVEVTSIRRGSVTRLGLLQLPGARPAKAKGSERNDLERLDECLNGLADLLFGMQLRKTDFVVFDRLDGETDISSVADYVDELTDPLHQIVKQRLREIN